MKDVNRINIAIKFKKSTFGASREFSPVLYRVCIAAWILKLIPIPIGLWNARLLSRTVTSAVAGDSEKVLKSGAVLLLLLALTKAFDFVAGFQYKKPPLRRCISVNCYCTAAFSPVPFLCSTVWNMGRLWKC